MPRFFVLPEKVGETEIIIDGDDVRHISKVLRMSVGDDIEVCDGRGYDYSCKVTNITQDKVSLEIKEKVLSVSEPSVQVTLFQGYPKSDKMEYIIQKCCELGIARIVPVMCERTVVKLKEGNRKGERYAKVAESAAKQSGRGIIPEVCEAVSFDEAVRMMSELDKAIMPYELEVGHSIKDVKDLDKAKTIGILIGPEGGFSAKEAQKAGDAGIERVTLGKRILRCETAGEITLALIMFETGNME